MACLSQAQVFLMSFQPFKGGKLNITASITRLHFSNKFSDFLPPSSKNSSQTLIIFCNRYNIHVSI